MNIWNKVLLCFVMVVSLAFVFLAVKDLKLHREWGDKAEILMGTEDEPGSIKAALKLQDELYNGVVTDGKVVTPGISQLSVELNRMMLERGRAWFNCQPKPFDQNGVMVKTSLPDPHGISAKSVVYVFEQKAAGQGGSYLGQFAVVAVAPQMVQLTPSRDLSPEEMQRAVDSQQSGNTLWALFETLPVDDPTAFEGLTEQQSKTLPPGVVAEYVDNPAGHKLRDYETYFREAYRLRSQAIDMLAATKRDMQYVSEASADARLQDQARRKEIDDLEVELAAVGREAEAVIVHRDNLQNKVDAMQAAITQTIRKNSELAGEIARKQLEAAKKIDRAGPQRTAQLVGK